MSEIEREGQPPQISIPVEWHVPDSIVSRYANNVFIQQGQYEFIISFFETRLPLLTGTSEEDKATLEQLESVRAECIGRIIVPPEIVPKIIQALQTTFKAYQATKEGEQRGGYANDA